MKRKRRFDQKGLSQEEDDKAQEEYKSWTGSLLASINKYIKLEPGTDLTDSNAFHKAAKFE